MANQNQEEKKILFATDFSPYSKKARDLIPTLHTYFKLHVYFIHVITSTWKKWVSPELASKEAQQRLENWQKRINPTEVDPSDCSVAKGNAADRILYQANKLAVNLIMLGAKNIDRHSRYKTGTTIESIVRHAKQSVLIVNTDRIQNILCGIDGSENSAKALKQAIALSKTFSAKLTLLYALPQADFNPLGMNREEVAQKEDEIRTEHTKKIQDFLTPFKLKQLGEVDELYQWGQPANVILDTAEDFDQDLIIIGAKGHSLLHHVMIGSTAEKVLRHVPCSLLVVR